MKSFAVVAAVLLFLAAAVRCGDMKVGSSYGGGSPAPAAGGYGGGSSGGYGGGASIPAPPCPKNYLFSCQPSLQPAPCAQAASGGYGSAGAYSHDYPVYAVPQYVNGYQAY